MEFLGNIHAQIFRLSCPQISAFVCINKHYTYASMCIQICDVFGTAHDWMVKPFNHSFNQSTTFLCKPVSNIIKNKDKEENIITQITNVYSCNSKNIFTR